MTVSPRRIRIDLAYDGTDYSGWQYQINGVSIQGVVEAVLTRLQGGDPVRLRGAGRTDAGVHARQQVADCELRTPLGDRDLAYTLYRLLPPDIRPVSVRSVHPEFHSRKSALRKTYRYRMDLSAYGDPRIGRYALHYRRKFDRTALAEAVRLLPGKRDWSGFAGSRERSEDRVRHLEAADFVEQTSGRAMFTFTADGFLNFMVRNLVGTLLEIARHRFPVERITHILESRDRNLAGPTAPPRGLCLWNVEYPPEADRVAGVD